MSNYTTIQGETIPMAAREDGGTGLGGSGIYGGAEGIYFTVLWQYNPNAGISGITGKDWPDDFKLYGGDYESILSNTAMSTSDQEIMINGYVQKYALYRMQAITWNEFATEYDTGGYNCIRYIGE